MPDVNVAFELAVREANLGEACAQGRSGGQSRVERGRFRAGQVDGR